MEGGSAKDVNECDVGLGLGTQFSESLPRKKIFKMMATSSNNFHCRSPVSLSSCNDESGGSGGGGSTFAAAFNSSGGMTFPFTAAQWKELERQTVIYKCMMASVPVPPELLMPITRNLSNVITPTRAGVMELGFSTNSNPEPWRCRRTDGKKWRCSRDVAPDQKYCERHSHKGRPRSRKPVELQADFLTNNNTPKNSQRPNFRQRVEEPICGSFPSSMAASGSSYEQPPPPRCLDWFIKGEANPVSCSSQQWQQTIQSNLDSEKLHVLPEHHEGPLKFYADYSESLFPSQTKETRHFIDAWSPSISLSMGGGNENDENNEDSQMGIGTFGLERENVADSRPHWMSPDTWMSSPPGGPLAEALCLGISSSSKPASPHANSSSSRSC